MASPSYPSWGRYPQAGQTALRYDWPGAEPGFAGHTPCLPRGNGRSYGDVCLNDGGALLDCRGLNRFIAFDETSGVLRCEAGVLLADILDTFVPRGWFLPVTPGTRFVTVGGAIANDVHGKNHHRAGTFGGQVRALELLRSDGTRLRCCPEDNADWFGATVGGLGLTGVITWAEIQLKSIKNASIIQETLPFAGINEFFDLAAESDRSHEYTVAWVDCLAQGQALGRGVFTRGNHAPGDEPPPAPRSWLSVPVELPFPLVSRLSLKAFNRLYRARAGHDARQSRVHYQPFFYPLDAIGHWNRIYGRRGFLQYQNVIPTEAAPDATADILKRVARSGTGSFLAVLKMFGEMASPGWLSFPMAGATLALDFPNRGSKTLRLLDELDQITHAAGGRVNPSKDARMSAAHFQQAFPRWQELENMRDPAISSSFWRRVTGQGRVK